MDLLSKNEAIADDESGEEERRESPSWGRSPRRDDSRCHDRLGIASHQIDRESTKEVPYSFPPFKDGQNLGEGRSSPSSHLQREQRTRLGNSDFFRLLLLDWLLRSSMKYARQADLISGRFLTRPVPLPYALSQNQPFHWLYHETC